MEATKLILLSALAVIVSAHPFANDFGMHSPPPRAIANAPGSYLDNVCRPRPEKELENEYWFKTSKDFLAIQKNRFLNKNTGKNAILFIGDGMSIPTLASSRAYMGQKEGKTGEETWLSFEKFPATGLSKTYCVDQQVADSACSATAYLGGVKGNEGTIGVNAKVCIKDCEAMNVKENHVDSLAKIFMDKGRSAGFVTTARVTHASPAGVYAHTAFRDWEFDGIVSRDGRDPTECKDMAQQLIRDDPGKRLKVIMGGGRRFFRNREMVDEEGINGSRLDNLDLIKEWEDLRKGNNESYQYVWNRDDLLSVSKDTDYLLGLFHADHCEYHLLADNKTQPTLEEMVEAAIKILSKDENGYFLFVEGGKIDHAHHETRPMLALDETVELSKAVEKAVELTSRDDTLIVVSSDHSHVMSYGGYPDRGNPILGSVGYEATDGMTFLTLNYANGPGYRRQLGPDRVNVAFEDGFLTDPNFRYPTLVPLTAETHGGEDVGVFALGPYQHLFTGVYEQSVIPYMMGYATCINDEDSACLAADKTSS